MKIKACLAALAVLCGTAQAADDGHDAHDGHGHAQQEQSAASPAEVARDFGYTMGYSMGGRIGADLGSIDAEAFVEGFRAALAGQPPRLDEYQMQQSVTAFQAQRMEELQAARAALAARNATEGKAFLDGNRKRKGVKTLPSGLQYEVLRTGKGASPKAEDMVSAHYRGTLPDGTEFDASDEEPVSFPLSRVIRGWQEGLVLMNKGAKYRLYVPSELAYGEQGAGDVIGPNQVLVFDVELIDFGPAPQPVPTGE